MEALLPLIIQLISGGAGGNIVGSLLKNLSLGPVGNTIAGALGGALGGNFALGPIIGGLLGATGAGDMTDILAQVASGGVSGGLLTVVLGLIKSMMSK